MSDGSSAAAASGPLQPVILGADIGVYALARSFHEAYGVTSVVVAGAALGPVAHSRIVRHEIVDDGHDPRQLVDRLVAVAQSMPDRRLLLMANSDWLVRVVVQHRALLEQYYVVPFLSEHLLDQISDKATFAQICDDLGISVPRTLVQEFGAAEPWEAVAVDLEYPLIAKAASSADYQDVEFEGKKKVFEIATPEELAWLWEALRTAGYRGRFVVQELVPGDDTQMRSITAYVDTRGEITLLCSAHVLLEEHTPSGLGQPGGDDHVPRRPDARRRRGRSSRRPGTAGSPTSTSRSTRAPASSGSSRSTRGSAGTTTT